MNQDILKEYLSLINHQIFSQEKLLEYLLKADSLFKVILDSDLSHYSHSTLYHYLWVLNDITHQARDLNETLLNTLIKLRLLIDPFGGLDEGNIH